MGALRRVNSWLLYEFIYKNLDFSVGWSVLNEAINTEDKF